MSKTIEDKPLVMSCDSCKNHVEITCDAVSKWSQKYIIEQGFFGMIDFPFAVGVKLTIDGKRYDIYDSQPQFFIDPRRVEHEEKGSFSCFIPEDIIKDTSKFLFHGLIYYGNVPRRFRVDFINVKAIINNKHVLGELDLFPDRCLWKYSA